jgi:hypothetical protein
MPRQLQLDFEQRRTMDLQAVLNHADRDEIEAMLVRIFLRFIGADSDKEAENER